MPSVSLVHKERRVVSRYRPRYGNLQIKELLWEKVRSFTSSPSRDRTETSSLFHFSSQLKTAVKEPVTAKGQLAY